MTKGIVLLAFGKRGYGFAAYNLAVSIRAFNNTIPITVYKDEIAFGQVEQEKLAIFDTVLDIDKTLIWKDGKIDPGFAKVNIYDMYPYDLNLYLDVDSLCLRDVAPLFDIMEKKPDYFYTHIIATHKIKGDINEKFSKEDRDFGSMQWAWADDIWEHFKLKQEDEFYATNSSYQIVKKGKKAKAFYDQIKKNYANPIPVDKLRMKWGGGQPDELYMNAALCQLKVSAQMDTDVMFFGGDLRHTFTEIAEKFYFLSLYGAGASNVATTRLKYREWYDRLLRQHFSDRGEGHVYKCHYIMNEKHANKRK